MYCRYDMLTKVITLSQNWNWVIFFSPSQTCGQGPLSLNFLGITFFFFQRINSGSPLTLRLLIDLIVFYCIICQFNLEITSGYHGMALYDMRFVIIFRGSLNWPCTLVNVPLNSYRLLQHRICVCTDNIFLTLNLLVFGMPVGFLG